MYVVYLTIYDGDELPRYYIGSSSEDKIKRGYGGSVHSKKYGETWRWLRKEHPERFKTIIIARFGDRELALKEELKLHKKLDVVKSEHFINMSYACPNGNHGMDVSGIKNPMYGKNHSESTKYKISIANSGHTVVWDSISEKYVRVTESEYCPTRHGKRPMPEGGYPEQREAVSSAMRSLVDEGKHWFQSDEFKKANADRRRGIPRSDEVKVKMSNTRKERFKRPWLIDHYSDFDFVLIFKIFDIFITHNDKTSFWEVHGKMFSGLSSKAATWLKRRFTRKEGLIQLIDLKERFENENN